MLKLLKNAYKALKWRHACGGKQVSFISPNASEIRWPDGYTLFNWIDNTGKVHFTHFTTEEERRLVLDHVSTAWRDGVVTVYLLRDEIMNDGLISKIQDELYSKNCDVKIVYNWKSN